MDNYTVIKSLHIIFTITWFASLLFSFRLFVYHIGAAKKNEPARSILTNQFRTMEKRMWYLIAWPSCIFTIGFGIWLLVLSPEFLTQPWMHIKLFLVVLFLVYQLYGQRVLRRIQSDPQHYSSVLMRLMNEVPTLLMIAIVFIVVMKEKFSWLWGSLALAGIAVIITLVIQTFGKKRDLEDEKDNGEELPNEKIQE